MPQGADAISVIVPAFQASSTIDKALGSLRNQSLKPLEVIVVDNGSSDQTESVVRSLVGHFRPVPLLLLREGKRGPSAARNRGAREATGSLLAFLDADCEAPPGWLQRIAEEIARGADAVGGPYQPAGTVSVIERYAASGWFSGKEDKTILARSSPFAHRFLLGGNLAVTRKRWEELGGFDETLKTGEDMDLTFRLVASGAVAKLLQDLAVTHRGSPPFLKRIRRGFSHGILQSRIVGREFRGCLLLSFFRSSWKVPFFFPVALELSSLTKTLLALFLLGWLAPPQAIGIFLFLACLEAVGMRRALVQEGGSISPLELLLLLFGWGSVRLAMEGGRVAGSLRHRVLCW